MNKILLFIIWLLLTILASVSSQYGLFLQGTDELKKAPYYEILLTTEFWATLQWAFAIPAIRVGLLLLSPAQIYLAGYVLGFFIQIISSLFIFKSSVYLDDYITMIIMLLALYVSKKKVFG